jgi:inhibitor of KinA sporulation pathway (predicted exonuclease)
MSDYEKAIEINEKLEIYTADLNSEGSEYRSVADSWELSKILAEMQGKIHSLEAKITLLTSP